MVISFRFEKMQVLKLCLSVIFVVGFVPHVFAQSDLLSLELDLEGMPKLIHEVEPRYPARAAARGIEGWVQVKFTIMADGTVDPFSIEITDADPWGMFNSAAIRAIEKFRYEPRVVDGVAVEMSNFQHVVRFEL
ncbi:MAG: energy transducer TonB [Pseudomonadota bacterium]|nr:hypothetical protein [Gammaproteobacteria bacterium]MBJ54243.1 hypothetical protein [Gammaproteobacteria bacterium]MEC8861101.1 energy transducer TonB [Pseudomonadota bacterium]HBN13961.1 hypothetical protein [Pseudohongiella sp.]|tara:strand:- start:316 stop:717 length:402 start_codon:yes stop_codon:yes gene_type:complete